MTHRQLYKSTTNKVFGGVLGGLGEYFDVDPVILRLLWVLIVIFTGVVPGVLVYIIALFIVPPKHHETNKTEATR